MRPAAQLALALAVVSASVAAAAASPVTSFPSANLGEAFRANVTHKWNVTGQGRGTSSFQILDGNCYFGAYTNVSFCSVYAEVSRVRPSVGNVTQFISFSVNSARLGRRASRATLNSRNRRLDEAIRQGYLTGAQQVVTNLQSVQDPEPRKGYTPLVGDVTITSVSGGVTSTLLGKSGKANVNGVVNYRGHVSTRTAKPGTLSGQYRIKVLKASASD